MKKTTKVLTVGATIALITTLVRWDYVIDLLELSVDAAASLVQSGDVSQQFSQEMDSLSVAKFINIPYFEEWTGEEIKFDEILGVKDE